MRYFLRLVPLAVLLFISSTRCRAEVIRNFDVDVRLQRDASLDITETLTVDFGKTPRHGIFRLIPLGRERMSQQILDLKLRGVTDEKNQPRRVQQTRANNELLLRIGEPTLLVKGVQIYRLRYIVKNAVHFDDGAPQLSWNATGDRWAASILKATARFYPPRGVKVSQLKTLGFRGARGATKPTKTTRGKDCVTYETTNLKPGEGLSFVARLPAYSLPQLSPTLKAPDAATSKTS